MSDNTTGGGEWGGEPDESNRPGSTELTSPNYGNDGETYYRAVYTVDNDGTAGNGAIIITSNGEGDEPNCLVIMTYYNLENDEQRDGMNQALDDLKDGEAPTTEGATVASEDGEGFDPGNDAGDEKKPGRWKRFKTWLKGVFGGGGDGLYIPYYPDEDGEGPGEGEPGHENPFGPTVLWVHGDEAKTLASGARDTAAWMEKNLSR